MADDIVTRLRDKHGQFRVAVGVNQTVVIDTIYAEAADEIECLRQELSNATAMANAYYELVQAYKWSHAHLGEWPEAIADLVAENFNLKKAIKNGVQP